MKLNILFCTLVFFSASVRGEEQPAQKLPGAYAAQVGQSIKNGSLAALHSIKNHWAIFGIGATALIAFVTIKAFRPRFTKNRPLESDKSKADIAAPEKVSISPRARARIKASIEQPEGFGPLVLPDPIPGAPPARFADLTESCVTVEKKENPDGTIEHVDEAGNPLGSRITSRPIAGAGVSEEDLAFLASLEGKAGPATDH